MNLKIFMYKSLPTITELRPLSIATKILIDPQYATLGEAIKQRLDIERECKFQNCPIIIFPKINFFLNLKYYI